MLPILLATSDHGICAYLCYKERPLKLGFVGVSEKKNHATCDMEARVYLTLTAKIISNFLLDVVKNGSSVTLDLPGLGGQNTKTCSFSVWKD